MTENRPEVPLRPPRRPWRAFVALRNALAVDPAFWRRRFWAGFRLAREAQRRGAMQKLAELAPLLTLIARRPPAVVVEIGTYRGGLFYALCKVADPHATLVSIDLPGGLFGGGYTEDELRLMRASGGRAQSLHFLARDSQDPATRNATAELLEGRPIDLLFIDGDHRYEGVRRDFELYSPLVRTGGLIAFHDILPHPQAPLCEVDVLWSEIRGRYRHLELVDRAEDWGAGQWGGIGVLHWPGAESSSRGLDDWDRHWDDYAESAAQNPAQAYRRRLVLRFLGSSENGRPERVLDIGSGTGDLAAEIRRAFPSAELVGLDVSAAAVEHAARKVPEATFLQRDLVAGSEPDPEHRQWATTAVCAEVLEHVEDPSGLLANARPYLAPGCKLIVTVPGGPLSAFDRHIGHRRHFSPQSLRAVLEQAGFAVDWTARAGFPFFNLYRLAVLLRGERLVDDVAQGTGTRPARLLMSIFGVLFRFNLESTPWGWQVLATAHIPGRRS